MDADRPNSPSSLRVSCLNRLPDSTAADERSFLYQASRSSCVVIAAVIGAFVGYPTWQDYVSQQEAKPRTACLCRGARWDQRC